jgi:hypothetical protein
VTFLGPTLEMDRVTVEVDDAHFMSITWSETRDALLIQQDREREREKQKRERGSSVKKQILNKTRQDEVNNERF